VIITVIPGIGIIVILGVILGIVIFMISGITEIGNIQDFQVEEIEDVF